MDGGETRDRDTSLLLNRGTVDIGYMVIGYMVKSGIWSIMSWSRFSHANKYRIYGQILDIWSENVGKFIAKTFH